MRRVEACRGLFDTGLVRVWIPDRHGREAGVLTADRADDVLRHRFSAAHELGHQVVQGGTASGKLWLEREADAFAAEFLTQRAAVEKDSPNASPSRGSSG